MLIRVSRVGTKNRVVLPVEVMDVLGVQAGDPIFFVVRDNTVRLSRSPQTFGEYLHLHAEPLASLDEDDDIDPRQMRFGWPEEEYPSL